MPHILTWLACFHRLSGDDGLLVSYGGNGRGWGLRGEGVGVTGYVGAGAMVIYAVAMGEGGSGGSEGLG